MRLFFPSTTDYISGPNSFVSYLQTYALERNISIVSDATEANVLLLPWINNDDLLTHKAKKIFRMCGLYYLKSRHDNEQLNNRILEYYQRSDFIVFQSQFSRDQFANLMCISDLKQHLIIHNGAYEQYFYPAVNSPDMSGAIKFVTTGNFRHLVMIKPIVDALDVISRTNRIEFHIVGNIRNEQIAPYMLREYITHHGVLNHQALAQVLRTCHIFLFTMPNSICPNSAIEAANCGLPVVGFVSGSMCELFPFSTDLLCRVREDAIEMVQELRPDELIDRIQYTIDNFTVVKERALANVHHYGFAKCGESYVEVARKIALSEA